jgi:GNAT superfamily N-acetyltransferase
MDIALSETDLAIADSFDVMVQLRPTLERDSYVARVRAQQARGYLLAAGRDGGRVVAVAGFRHVLGLAWGESIYVDDLVTTADGRSRGYGKAMLDWLVARARAHGCEQLHLDSGVQRFGAHRFYLREGMHISSHHFALSLGD